MEMIGSQGKALSMVMQKRKTRHVLYVKCTKRFQKIFYLTISLVIKWRGPYTIHEQRHVCVRTLEFYKENFFGRRLHQSRLIVRITLHSLVDKPP